MPITIYRADICGSGDTREDAEISWMRNIRRMMRGVQSLRDAIDGKPNTNFMHAVSDLVHGFNAATDPRQETKWPARLIPSITELDRLENSSPFCSKGQRS
jgi:hypothetical protein